MDIDPDSDYQNHRCALMINLIKGFTVEHKIPMSLHETWGDIYGLDRYHEATIVHIDFPNRDLLMRFKLKWNYREPLLEEQPLPVIKANYQSPRR